MSATPYTTPTTSSGQRAWSWLRTKVLRPLTTRAVLWLLLALLPHSDTLDGDGSSLKNVMDCIPWTPPAGAAPDAGELRLRPGKLPNFAPMYRNSLIVTLGAVVVQTTLATAGRLRLRPPALRRPRPDLLHADPADLRAPRRRPDGPVRADELSRPARHPVRPDPRLLGRPVGADLHHAPGLHQPPADFEDAAQIDGCNRFQAFWHIMVPMVTGAMVVVALFEFIRVWGEYLFTLTMLDDREKFTLGIGMVQQFSSRPSSSANLPPMAARPPPTSWPPPPPSSSSSGCSGGSCAVC